MLKVADGGGRGKHDLQTKYVSDPLTIRNTV